MTVPRLSDSPPPGCKAFTTQRNSLLFGPLHTDNVLVLGSKDHTAVEGKGSWILDPNRNYTRICLAPSVPEETKIKIFHGGIHFTL